jgi:ABC-2 type transport system permease protein
MIKPLNWDFNPIIVKELRSRMRGGRAFMTLTIALLFLGSVSYAIYQMTMATSTLSSMPISPQIGQTIFAGLVFFELMMVFAVTPAVTATVISDEKEKLTYEMLLATPLHPVSVLWGKLVSSLSYIFLLIFAAVPMLSLVFIFGGVTIRDILKSLFMLVVIALMVGVIGIFMSALLGRSGRATAVTYVIVLLLVVGPLLISAGIGTIRQSTPPRWALVLSPISALASSMSPSVNLQNLSSLFWMFAGTYWIMAPAPISFTSIPRPLYHYSLPLFIGISLVLYLIASRLVLPNRRWKLLWTEAVTALVLILGYTGMVSLGYMLTSNRYENVLISTPTPTPTPWMENLPIIPENESTIEVPPGDNKVPPAQTPTPAPYHDSFSSASSIGMQSLSLIYLDYSTGNLSG